MNKRDIEHLRWIYDRMVHVHGENPNVDYMRRFAEIVPPIREPDDYVVQAHAALSESCESWRRSLFLDGPTDHLHSNDCTRVADARSCQAGGAVTTYHKKRHPWRNQDLRSDAKRAAEPRMPPPPGTIPHTCTDPVCEATAEIPRLINTWDQLTAAVAAKLIPKRHALAISYQTPVRHAASHGVFIWSPFYKTDPKSAWYDHGRATFDKDRDVGTAEAKLWAGERGYTGKWLRNAFMDWVPEIVQKSFPIKRRSKP